MSDLNEIQEEVSSGLDITDTIKNFKNALVALVPIFEDAKIIWKDEPYDDFEGIAESLFDWLVKYKAENIINQSQHINLVFPNYGFFYKNYSKMSYIEVDSDDNRNSNLVFVYLTTKNKPFDTIYCNKINRYGIVEEEGIEIPFDSSYFVMKHKY